MTKILIGTSGYDYPEWKGIFYPADLKRKDFLLYYSTVFNALEVNNTFYNMPTKERLISFWERSEGRLRFSVKANRLLTHEIFTKWKDDANDFKRALAPLQEKDALSAVLFQFPESFHYTAENRIYLAKLIENFEGFPAMIEFRHREWVRPSVFEGLEERKAGIVFCDMPKLRNLPDGKNLKTPFVGENAYIRLHGRNADTWYAHAPGAQMSITSTHANDAHAAYCHESPDEQNPSNFGKNGSARYCYDYSDEELEEFVPVVKQAMNEGKRVQMFFNNHPNGSGARNAKKMREIVGAKSFQVITHTPIF